MAIETLTLTTTTVTKTGERLLFPYASGTPIGLYASTGATLVADGVTVTAPYGVSFGATGATVTPAASYEIPAGALALTVNYAASVKPEVPPHPGIRTGSIYYFGAGILAGTATAAVVANNLYALPFLIPNQTINRIAVEVTTGAAGLCRLGIYSNKGGVPGTLLLDAGTVDTTTIATVEASFADFVCPPDWIWVVAVFNAAPTMRRATTAHGAFMGTSGVGATTSGIAGSLTFASLPVSAPASWVGANPPQTCVRRA